MSHTHRDKAVRRAVRDRMRAEKEDKGEHRKMEPYCRAKNKSQDWED